MLDKTELIRLTLFSFEAERTHQVQANMDLLHDEFKVVDMVLSAEKTVFPSLSGEKLHELMKTAFMIKGREFTFPTIIADEHTQTVMVEFIESYPDPVTNKVYRTPQVAVCRFKDGKLFRTRHYMDPRISYEFLDTSQIDAAFE